MINASVVMDTAFQNAGREVLAGSAESGGALIPLPGLVLKFLSRSAGKLIHKQQYVLIAGRFGCVNDRGDSGINPELLARMHFN